MCRVTFKRITPEESRIFADDEHVGNVYRQPDTLHEGEHYYVVVLDEDWRGPLRVHQRHPHPGRHRRAHPDASSMELTPPVRLAGNALASIPAAVPGGEAAEGGVWGNNYAPRCDRSLSHACSLQQPCGSSGRSAPCGLAKRALRAGRESRRP